MKNLIPILSLLTLLVTQALADEPRTLTIYGTVDPRLDVSFMSTYRGTNIDRIECSDMNPSTGRRKVKLAGLSKHVTTTDYNITMPIDYTDANECGYEFVSIDAVMRRKYDNKMYANFPVLSKGGHYLLSSFGDHADNGTHTSYQSLDTEKIKPYFRLARESVFLCKTEQWTTKKERDDFICTLQMKFDTEGGLYHKDQWGTTHPEFKIDELRSWSLKIDVKVDDLKEPFRELPKPSPSVMESLKSLF